MSSAPTSKRSRGLFVAGSLLPSRLTAQPVDRERRGFSNGVASPPIDPCRRSSRVEHDYRHSKSGWSLWMPWVAGCSHFTHDQSSIFLRFAACRRSSLATLGDCSSLRALALTRGSAAPSLISLDEGRLRSTRSSDKLVSAGGYFSGDRMPSSAARSSSSFRRRSSRAATSLSRLAASTAASSAAINGVTAATIFCGDSFAK